MQCMQCSKISTFLFLQLEVLAKLGPATQKEMQGKLVPSVPAPERKSLRAFKSHQIAPGGERPLIQH